MCVARELSICTAEQGGNSALQGRAWGAGGGEEAEPNDFISLPLESSNFACCFSLGSQLLRTLKQPPPPSPTGLLLPHLNSTEEENCREMLLNYHTT